MLIARFHRQQQNLQPSIEQKSIHTEREHAHTMHTCVYIELNQTQLLSRPNEIGCIFSHI